MAHRRAFGKAISQRIEDHPDFLDFVFLVTRQISTLVFKPMKKIPICFCFCCIVYLSFLMLLQCILLLFF